MPFKYRLQQFLEIRINKRDEQPQVVQECQEEVFRIEGLIAQNNQNIQDTRINMRKSDPRMYDGFDKFLKHLYEEGEKLEVQRQNALNILHKEEETLRQREKEVNVLEKHKEHKKEEFLYEEKMLELKNLNEIGSQKHFMRSREAAYEAELEEMLMKNKEKNH